MNQRDLHDIYARRVDGCGIDGGRDLDRETRTYLLFDMSDISICGRMSEIDGGEDLDRVKRI